MQNQNVVWFPQLPNLNPTEVLKALAADSTQTIALKGSQPGKGTSPCIEPLNCRSGKDHFKRE